MIRSSFTVCYEALCACGVLRNLLVLYKNNKIQSVTYFYKSLIMVSDAEMAVLLAVIK